MVQYTTVTNNILYDHVKSHGPTSFHFTSVHIISSYVPDDIVLQYNLMYTYEMTEALPSKQWVQLLNTPIIFSRPAGVLLVCFGREHL